MNTIYKKYPANSIRNNRERPSYGKRYVRVDCVSGTLNGVDIDNFSLKKVFKKIDEAAGKVVNAIAPKVHAKIQASREDGKVTLKESLGIAGKTVTNVLAPIAAVGLGVGFAGQAIKKASDNKDLRADQESALTPIPSIEPPKVAEIVKAVEPQTPVDVPKKTVGEIVKNVASKITPSNIDKATQLMQSGKGLLTADQEKLRRNLTSPAMLPKTKASKENERALTLPYVSTDEKSGVALGSIPFDKNTIVAIGAVIAVIVVLSFLFKK